MHDSIKTLESKNKGFCHGLPAAWIKKIRGYDVQNYRNLPPQSV